jgi:photosystem II stability/assembly factor-like uncharacterized protein
MRPVVFALLVSASLAPRASAGELHHFEDAPLRAIQFVDHDEGWAVGDDGVILHTFDAGNTWERQPTGVRASLQSLFFLTPYIGWAAGREELANGKGSAGVLLTTRDGGLKWQRVTLNALPGLNCVRFRDDKNGLIAGDGTDQYPSGVFQTKDGGQSWQPVSGPRATTWLAADLSTDGASLGGAWNRLAVLHGEKMVLADVDWLGGRSLRGLQIVKKRGVAVGQGGLVLLSDDTAGASWSLADLKLSEDLRASCDFHAVHCVGKHIWIVGRPGSVVLHSGDAGDTWSWEKTGQNMPLNGLYFMDARQGWAVGELGTILGTVDGGKTWKVQRRGGQRAAALVLQARSPRLPLESIALLGAEDGYLTTALRVVSSDAATAAPQAATESQRLIAAMRQAGGAAGETLWQFPLPQYLLRGETGDLLKAWDRLHADRAAPALLRQLVLALRIWRPNIVVSDLPEKQGDELTVDALVAEAVREAFKQAADSKAFPEQITQLGLEPWKADKLYCLCADRKDAQVIHDTGELCSRLQAPAREFAASGLSLLTEAQAPPVSLHHYRLMESCLDGAKDHRDLLQGITLAMGGEARRDLGPVQDISAELKRAWQARRNLLALAETPAGPLNDPNKLLARIGPALEGLPVDQAAPAAFAVASQFARMGQWELAREVYLLVVDRYPAHPLAVDSCRWLIRYNSSSEVRRRHELGQFLMVGTYEIGTRSKPEADRPEARPDASSKGPETSWDDLEYRRTKEVTFLGGAAFAKRWYEGSLQLEPRLASLGPLFANDTSMQFCLQAARRQLGQVEMAQKWYGQFASKQPPGPWRDAALAELWLANKSGTPPKPVASCRLIDTRPFLDGKLDDACWQNAKPLVLKNASGSTVEEYPTEVKLAYDKDFLYVAIRCKHPADRYIAPAKVRQRDADVRPFDHVDLLLDLDRDYHTCFHLQVDQRGCVCEDCWGDLSWNPRWFVALQSNKEGWQVEAAIPMLELTGDVVTIGKTWACNVTRILPGRGVQSWSLPADVDPRPEGMGLLMFLADPNGSNTANRGKDMPRVP